MFGGGEGGGNNTKSHLTSVQQGRQESKGEVSPMLVKDEVAWGLGVRGSPYGLERGKVWNEGVGMRDKR